MIEIKDSYFKGPDGNRYFRRNAMSASVGAYGPKKQPLTQANYLSVDGHMNYDYLNGHLQKSEPQQINWQSWSKADVETEVKTFFDIGGVSGAFSAEKAGQAELVLIRFSINDGPLMTVLNTKANKVRSNMKEEGNDARVCSSVWVVVTSRLAQRFTSSAGLDVSATTTEGIKITAKGGASWSGSEVVTLGPGTVFAYGLHKVTKWDGDKVKDMDYDWQSLG